MIDHRPVLTAPSVHLSVLTTLTYGLAATATNITIAIDFYVTTLKKLVTSPPRSSAIPMPLVYAPPLGHQVRCLDRRSVGIGRPVM